MPRTETWLDPHELIPRLKAGELRSCSPTLLNDADTCLRRAGYKLTEPSFRPGEHMICGTGYHAGLETAYKWRMHLQDEVMDTGEIPEGWPAPPDDIMQRCYDAVAAAVFYEVWDDEWRKLDEDFEWDTSYAETVDRAQKMVYAYFAGGHFWDATYVILGVEIGYATELAVPGWATRGVIDLIVGKADASEVIIEDHKTAGKKWKKNKESPRATNQPAMYDAAWTAVAEYAPTAFSFAVMTYDGEFERRTFAVKPQDRELVVTKQRTMLPLLNAHLLYGLELPGNTNSFLCSEKWCDFWEKCPLGAASRVVLN